MGRPIIIKTAKQTPTSQYKVVAKSPLTKRTYVAFTDTRDSAKSLKRRVENDFKVKIRRVKGARQ